MARQSSNIELRPSISKACAEERQQHCADVRPGKARVLDCLLAQADKVGRGVGEGRGVALLGDLETLLW